MVGSVEKRHVSRREAAAKTRIVDGSEGVNVIPTDGMFTETDFSRPSPSDIPANEQRAPPIHPQNGQTRFPSFHLSGQRAAQKQIPTIITPIPDPTRVSLT